MSPWAVVFGGPSPEHEISILTGLQAERVLTRAGEQVVSLYWGPTGAWHLVPNGTEAKDYLEGAPSGSRPLEVRLGSDGGFFVKGRLRSGGAAQLPGAQQLQALVEHPRRNAPTPLFRFPGQLPFCPFNRQPYHVSCIFRSDSSPSFTLHDIVKA